MTRPTLQTRRSKAVQPQENSNDSCLGASVCVTLLRRDVVSDLQWPNLGGIGQGLDNNRNAALLRHGTQLNPDRRHLLRRILADAVWTAELKHRIGKVPTTKLQARGMPYLH